VVVNYLYIKSITVFKSKTDAPLVIDSNTPLPAAVVTQCFKPVRGRQTQILNPCSRVQLRKPDSCASMDVGWKTTRSSGRIESLCFTICKRSNHAWIVNRLFTIVNELLNKHQPWTLRRRAGYRTRFSCSSRHSDISLYAAERLAQVRQDFGADHMDNPTRSVQENNDARPIILASPAVHVG